MLPQYNKKTINKFSIIELLKFIEKDKDSKKLSLLILINLILAFTELIYGLKYNSLSLQSDSLHMFFDCSALIIGIYAQFMSRLNKDPQYTYGYHRYQVLSGYVNAIFLIFIAFYILVESFERLFHPPKIQATSIITVSILGFFVNMIGLLFFHEHAHYVPNNKNSHQHSNCNHSHNHNHNLEAVFLHILADALGSVGVLISTLLIIYYDLQISDAICSFIISFLIILSVIPLIKNSSYFLLQSYPPRLQQGYKDLIEQLRNMNSIKELKSINLWGMNENNLILNIRIKTSDPSPQVLQQIKKAAENVSPTLQLELEMDPIQ